MSNDPAAGGDQPGWQGQQPYPGTYGQHGDQPGYPGSAYPPPTQQAGYGQAPPPWASPSAPQPGGQHWPGGPAGAGPGGVPSQTEAQTLFSALFDFGFTRFATPVVVRALYVLLIVAIGLAYAVFVIVFFYASPGMGLVALLAGGVFALLALVYNRLLLEQLYVHFRMAEDIRAMRNRQ
jgi:Domain of unknown function (DUF4282)